MMDSRAPHADPPEDHAQQGELKASQKDQGSKQGRQDRSYNDHRHSQAIKQTSQDEGGHRVHPHGDGIK